MRINSGNFKYRKITLPEDIRPTTEKVREAVFSMVMATVPGANVLDLFAGSGILGLEALSRGASHCWFNELDRRHTAIIRSNIEHCGAEAVSTVYNKDFRKCLRTLKSQMDLILLDPPYQSGYYREALEIIDEEDLLSDDGVIVAEHLYANPLEEQYGKLLKIKEKKYGTIGVDLFVKGGQDR